MASETGGPVGPLPGEHPPVAAQTALRPGAVTGTVSVVVAVATYRRPAGLAVTLDLILAQIDRDAPGGRVLVVDNDPDHSAADVVRALAHPALDYVSEPRPGIAAARNRALDESTSRRFLVFVDDDETPSDRWLATLLRAAGSPGCEAASGPVVSVFDRQPEPWITDGGFFERRRPAEGTVVRVAATNNLSLDLDFVRRHALRFDERFGLSGGSDTLFTSQLSAAGGRIRWCAEAVVVDRVPVDRLTRRWVLRRAMRYGNSASRVALVLAVGPVDRLRCRARLLGYGALRLVAGAARVAAGAVTNSSRHRARGRRTCMKGVGYVRGALGSAYVEYGREH